MTKKLIQTLCLGSILTFFVACKKESTSPTQTADPVKQKSKLELLCQDWILEETYENNVQKTSNGTGEYRFTRQGGFQFNSNNSWMSIGSFDFVGKDSAAIAVLFSGSTSAIHMDIKEMNESVLNTEFTTNNKDFIYKYKR